MATILKNKKWKSLFLATIIVIIVLAVILSGFDAKFFLRDMLTRIEGTGTVGILVFILIYILACVLFLPGSILTMGAGTLFGVIKGSIIVSISSTLGATLAFFIGRYFARNWIAKKIEGKKVFESVDEAVAEEGGKIVFLTRLSPVFPFNLLNYAFGLTKVSLKGYFFASWLGMLPGTIMYVYIGSLAGNLAGIGASERSKSTVDWALYIVGFLATIGVSIYITKIAKQALSKKI